MISFSIFILLSIKEYILSLILSIIDFNSRRKVKIFEINKFDKNSNEYFYDLDKIKDTGQKVVDNKSKPITDSSVSFNNNNIPQSNNNVNIGTKYSMQESVNNTQINIYSKNDTIKQ